MQQELKIIVKADGTATVTRQLDSVNQSINKIETSKNKLAMGGDFMKGMIGGALTAAAAYLSVRAAINTANRALNEFTDSYTNIQQLQAVLNSTGRAAEFTTGQLADMASELMGVTGIGDDDILKGATIGLLRFDSVSKDIFPRAQRLAIDMSKAFGGIEGATKALGLALADPIMGMNKMKRAGAEFTDQQRELISSLMETGDKAAAQSVLMRILESDYHNAAMAGVTGATMLKTAWGEYLETLGGSISAFDGVKRGLAQFFLGVAQNSNNLSKAQMQHIIDVQERWAIATLEISQRGKQIITIMGGTVATVFGLLQDTMNGVYYAFNNVYGAVINVFNGLGKIAPRFMEAITGVSTFSDALNDLKNDFSSAKGFVSIDAFGAETQKNLKNWIATFTNANAAIQSGKEGLIEFYDAQRKLVESGKSPFTGADMAEGETAENLFAKIDAAQAEAVERLGNTTGDMLSAWAAYYSTLDQYSNESIQHQANLYKYQLQQQYGTILSMQQIDEMYNAKLWELRDAQLAHFADNHEVMVERLGNTTGEMLSAWSTYYTTLNQYSNESIQAQADLYKYQLQQQYGTILSMQQIDEMYNAKLWELRDAQLAHFKEVNAQLPEIAKTDWEKMTEYAVNAANEMQNSGLNLLENSIYDLISGTNSLKNVWANAWAAMEQIALRAMAEIITKMLTTISLQKLLGLGFGVLGIGSAVIGAPGAADIPSMPIASITPSMPSIPTGGNTNFELITAINGLRSDLSQNQNPNFQLLLDGKELHHGLKRVSSRLNYMGARA